MLGWSGHVYPALAVAQALLARGHAVAMQTATPFAALVASAGVAYFPPTTAPDRFYDRLTESFPALVGLPNAEVLARLFGGVALRDGPDQARDLVVASTNWRPDVLVNDGVALGTPLAAGVLRLPWATVSPFLFCTIPDPNLPPPYLGLSWRPGLAGRLAARAANQAAELRLAAESRRWRTLAAVARLPRPAPSIRGAGCSPWLYVYPGGPPLEYPRRRTLAHVHGVGPLEFERAEPDAPPNRDGWPRVFVTEGTTHTDLRLCRLALRALAAQPVELLLVVGRAEHVAALGPLPANAQAVARVSYRAALAGARLLITNGGAGSLLAALDAGVPSLILPAGLDKGEAAQRIAWAGAGLRLPQPVRCSVERLRAGALRLLAEPNFARRAEAVGREMAQLGGPAHAASLLEELAARRR